MSIWLHFARSSRLGRTHALTHACAQHQHRAYQSRDRHMANSNKSLASQVSRLGHDHPIVRRYAVATIFELLAQHDAYSSKAGRDAMQLCFQQSRKVRSSLCLLALRILVVADACALRHATSSTSHTQHVRNSTNENGFIVSKRLAVTFPSI